MARQKYFVRVLYIPYRVAYWLFFNRRYATKFYYACVPWAEAHGYLHLSLCDNVLTVAGVFSHGKKVTTLNQDLTAAHFRVSGVAKAFQITPGSCSASCSPPPPC
jgi:hypothetical protein